MQNTFKIAFPIKINDNVFLSICLHGLQQIAHCYNTLYYISLITACGSLHGLNKKNIMNYR